MFCPKCGTWIPEGQDGCSQCDGTPAIKNTNEFHDNVNFDTTGAIGKAWDLFTAKPWPFLGITLIYLAFVLIIGTPNYAASAMEAMAQKGYEGLNILSLLLKLMGMAISFFFAQPILALTYHLIFQQTRTSAFSFSEAFKATARKFWQLVLLNLVINLLFAIVITIALLPVLGIAGIFTLQNKIDDPAAISVLIVTGIVFGTLALAALFYVQIRLFMTNMMIIDRDYDAIQAIKASSLAAQGNYLSMIGYSFLIGFIVVAGILLCCLGLLPALALAFMAHVCLYEQLRA